MKREELIKLIPNYSRVKYGNAGTYVVANIDERFGVIFVGIYDEPPSSHIDYLSGESVENADNLASHPEEQTAEDKPCNKCTYNGHTTVCEKCNDFNDYEHFVYNDPYSKESMNFFKRFIKARKELCHISPTDTYSLEEAIRKSFDEYASQTI